MSTDRIFLDERATDRDQVLGNAARAASGAAVTMTGCTCSAERMKEDTEFNLHTTIPRLAREPINSSNCRALGIFVPQFSAQNLADIALR